MRLQGLLTIYLCGISVLASSLSQSIKDQQTSDNRAQVSYNKTQITEFSIQRGAFTINNVSIRRPQVDFCERIAFGAGACRWISGYIISAALFMIETIKDLSGEDSCDAMRGNYESLTWFYHSSNRDCHRNSQRAMITGAIGELFRHHDIDQFHDTHCLRFDEGGSLDGWLKLGPTASFSSDPYCDGRNEHGRDEL